MKNSSSLILFDGACNFCNASVQFIIRHDKKGRYRFASLQSNVGKEYLAAYHVPKDVDSIVLIENGVYFTHSAAALRICKHLDGVWKYLYASVIIPKPLRDLLYNWIAKHRYQLFGKQEACMMPTKEIKERFLAESTTHHVASDDV